MPEGFVLIRKGSIVRTIPQSKGYAELRRTSTQMTLHAFSYTFSFLNYGKLCLFVHAGVVLQDFVIRCFMDNNGVGIPADESLSIV